MIPKAPIVVELSALENQGYSLAGTAPDDNVRAQIEIVLTAAGMEAPTAEFMAQKLSAAALLARAKIKEATAFEIKVGGLPSKETKPKGKKAPIKSGIGP